MKDLKQFKSVEFKQSNLHVDVIFVKRLEIPKAIRNITGKNRNLVTQHVVGGETSCDDSRRLFLGVTTESDRSHEVGQVFRISGSQ